MTANPVHSFSQPLVIETPSSLSESVRNLISNTFAPFQQEYRHWPWSQIGSLVVVCIGSYTLYRYLPGPYRRYYMSSTKNFSHRYNEALHAEKKTLFNELSNVTTREEGRKIQVVEIGAAHGANMTYYPPHGKITDNFLSLIKVPFFPQKSNSFASNPFENSKCT